MLLEFTVENFRSFKAPQTLSMLASADKTYQDSNTFIVPDQRDLRLVSSAIIYGPNASGKSNLIKAMRFVEKFVWMSATKAQEGTPIEVVPFKLDPVCANAPSRFEVMFIQNDVRYHYGIAVDKKIVHEEWLAAYPKGRRQVWFERFVDSESKQTIWKMGQELKGSKEQIKEFVRSNSLFLSHAAQNNHPQLTPVFRWFSEKFANLLDVETTSRWTAEKCSVDREFCNRVLELVQIADPGIEGLTFEDVEIDPKVFSFLTDDAKKDLVNQVGQKIKTVKTHHKDKDGNEVVLDLDDESDGTKRFFNFAGPCLDVIENGMILFIDELDRSLHAKLTRHFISLFHRGSVNQAQVISTSHDVSLLDQKLFRRDQIWFIEKKADGSSSLYPLSDFSPRKDESLQKGYLLGRYGAVPFIKEDAQ